MLNNTLEQKSALAKLLATENLRVTYSARYPTAFFDLDTRTIHIPLMSGLDEDLLDLFEGHEVGHAIDTPAEGFHSAIKENSEYADAFKSYLNVVEDIRIERKMKLRYPGIKRPFLNAYRKLTNLDFFGENIAGRINNMAFIDRLNIQAKIGAHVFVKFTDEEQKLVDEAYELETWDDVVAYVHKIFDRQSNKNKQKAAQSQPQSGMPRKKSEDSNQSPPQNSDNKEQQEAEDESLSSSDETNDSISTDSEESSDESDETDDGADSEGSDDKPDDGDDSDGSDESDDETESSDSEETDSNSDEGSDGTVAPSETDNNFRRKEQEMIDKANNLAAKSPSQPGRVEIERVPYEQFLLSAKSYTPALDNNLRNLYVAALQKRTLLGTLQVVSDYDAILKDLQNEHRKQNADYVSFLVKEFEMRKNARILNRGKVSKSGKVDINRIHKYNICNDVFKRITSYPEGKNHGMCMYIDLSGSMMSTISSVINQVLILSDFCKKVNIPFRVFGFSTTTRTYDMLCKYNNVNDDTRKETAGKVGTFLFDNIFVLKEYISSELRPVEYKTAFNNLLMVKAIFESYRVATYRYSNFAPKYTSPENINLLSSMDLNTIGEGLGTTPLNSAVVLSIQMTNDFVAKYKVENMVNIFLSDGEDNRPHTITLNSDKHQSSNSVNINSQYKVGPSMISGFGVRHMTECVRGTAWSTSNLLKFARKATGARYIGFFVVVGKLPLTDIASSTDDFYKNMDIIKSKYRKDGYVTSPNFGFDTQFFISSKETIMNDDDDEKGDDWWKSIQGKHEGKKDIATKLIAKGFINQQTKKQLNRIMLVEFTKAIAEVA